MKTANETGIQQHLKAVERAASGLPAARRQELVADLAERLDITLAERPAGVRNVLRGLVAQRTVATTAPKEKPEATTTPRRGSVHPLVPVLLSALAFPAAALALPAAAGPVLGLVIRAVGLVLLWMSAHWTYKEKWNGTAMTFLVPVAFVQGQHFFDYDDTAVIITNTLVTGLPLVGAVWLWAVRRP
ncbi:hypothetical protein ACFVXE_12620 [Streptomyces sp. NPDC058231]|uniref:hypothetical protein n=1 Tax=Streptomyces sp. NPDC058231 TaxID=3346392 RepID=UPI0036F036B0